VDWSSFRRRLPAPIQTAASHLYQQRQWLERVRHGPISNAQPGHDLVRELVERGVGAAGKIGESELGGLTSYLHYRNRDGFAAQWTRRSRRLYTNAGVFPDNVLAYNDFASAMSDALSHLDVLAAWYNPGEARVVRSLAPRARLVGLTCLEPHLWHQPWFSALRDKRVLVITPFADTVRAQFERMPKIWSKKPEMAVSFELLTLRTPFAAAIAPSPYRDWQSGLDDLRRSMDMLHFDVAIIGAGAWSVPLAAHAKLSGRVGVHLGGATQILFGVRGRRWDTNPKHAPFITDAWVRPGERPAQLSKIEGGCYW
jgi:hypothetical protein